MEEHKFSNSNLDFNELFDKYKTLNTTYSDIVDFKINIYENCNLLQNLITTFTVPSTNIRLRSFKNNYIIADTQTLYLNQEFYEANDALFTTVETYINNINLTNIIKTHFDYANSNIYPSKKIIIKISLHKEIVDKDGTGALQINMQEIKEHFHSLFDTLELDINQYVTGKHGTLEATNREPPNNVKGGNGQNANENSAGPAINITNNDDSYFKLDIRTNGNVIGGFGASGGNGGNGKINETGYTRIDALTVEDGARFTFPLPALPSELLYIRVLNVFKGYYYENTTAFFWEGFVKEIRGADTAFSIIPPLVSPATFPEEEFQYFYDDDTNTYIKKTLQYVEGTIQSGHDKILASGTDDITYITRYSIKKLEYTYTKTGEIPPTVGGTGFTATYSNNAKTENIFNTQSGNTGITNNGTGGTGGRAGIQGGITNITATNITIIDS